MQLGPRPERARKLILGLIFSNCGPNDPCSGQKFRNDKLKKIRYSRDPNTENPEKTRKSAGPNPVLPFLCAPVCLVQTPFRASGPKWEKKDYRKNIGFGLPQKLGKKLPKNRKITPNPNFYRCWGHFSQFSAIFFLIFWGRPKPIFFLFFPISGRRREIGSAPGKQDRNLSLVVWISLVNFP